MAVAIYEDVREILNPAREAKIYGAFTKAWNDWENLDSKVLFSRFPGTRANVLHERDSVDDLREVLRGVNRVFLWVFFYHIYYNFITQNIMEHYTQKNYLKITGLR